MNEISVIEQKEAVEFLLPKHYSGRKPNISVAFGWKIDGVLVAVCTFGKPASASLCVGICGKDEARHVYELNRLCRIDEFDGQLSKLVGFSLRFLKSKNWIVVSYSDLGMSHNGYIYQACNFLYTGTTVRRTDKYTEGNKHSRHYSNNAQNGLRKVRTAKRRYVFFCGKSKIQNRNWRKLLRYPIEPYPKSENKNYTLGDYQKPEVIKESGHAK